MIQIKIIGNLMNLSHGSAWWLMAHCRKDEEHIENERQPKQDDKRSILHRFAS